MMTKMKTQGLVSDLMPNIKLMQLSGHFLFNYHSENAGMSTLLRKVYASVHAFLIIINYLCMAANMAQYSDEVNELTANTITVLFFAHTVIKLVFFAINSKSFYRRGNGGKRKIIFLAALIFLYSAFGYWIEY